MQPFVGRVDAFHARTAPADWLEGLVKAYVGDGVAADFYREVAGLLDPETQALVADVLADTGHAEFVIARVRAAIEADPRVAGRLALWARRLVGEALGQAQRVAAERAPLAGCSPAARPSLGEHRPDVRRTGRRARPPDGRPGPGARAVLAARSGRSERCLRSVAPSSSLRRDLERHRQGKRPGHRGTLHRTGAARRPSWRCPRCAITLRLTAAGSGSPGASGPGIP